MYHSRCGATRYSISGSKPRQPRPITRAGSASTRRRMGGVVPICMGIPGARRSGGLDAGAMDTGYQRRTARSRRSCKACGLRPCREDKVCLRPALLPIGNPTPAADAWGPTPLNAGCERWECGSVWIAPHAIGRLGLARRSMPGRPAVASALTLRSLGRRRRHRRQPGGPRPQPPADRPWTPTCFTGLSSRVGPSAGAPGREAQSVLNRAVRFSTKARHPSLASGWSNTTPTTARS